MIQFNCFAISEQQGDPSGNNDFSIIEPGDGIFIIADGMGGRPGGSEASVTAASSFYKTICALEPQLRMNNQCLLQAVNKANAQVRDIAKADPTMRGLGTTLSAVVLQERQGKIIHVGDSRIYLFRDDYLFQLTKDHTLVETLIEQRRMTVEGAKHYPLRNVLVRSIGAIETVEPDILDLTVRAGDWLILTTDGLGEVMDRENLKLIVAAEKTSPAEKLCKAIMTIARHKEIQDDITLIAVQVVNFTRSDYSMERNRKLWAG